MKKETLKLFVENGVWITQSDNPAWQELFGTDSVPTCYLSSMAADIVLREIQSRNPDCKVVLRNTVKQELSEWMSECCDRIGESIVKHSAGCSCGSFECPEWQKIWLEEN